MNEFKQPKKDFDWVMSQLEDYLADAEQAGDGDMPPWVTF